MHVWMFPQSKLQYITDDTAIVFNMSVRDIDENFNATIYNNKTYTYYTCVPVRYTINLVLLGGHYMLNKSVPITTIFVVHYNDIIKCHSDWSIDRIWLVYRYDEEHETYNIMMQVTPDITRLLKVLFKKRYFEPITIGDVATYSSLLYKAKLPALTDLK